MLEGKLSTHELVPAGNHSSVLVAAVALGTHWQKGFQGGDPKQVGWLMLVWELLCEMAGVDTHVHIGQVFNVPLDRDGQPSFGPKAKLLGFLQDWRGKPYQGKDRVSPVPFIKQPCLVHVTHGKTAGGQDFAGVKSCSPLPKGMAAIEPLVIPIVYDAGSKELPPNEKWLPFVYGRKIEDVVKESLEWGGDGGKSKLSAPAEKPAA
jgi:hypothetical protein